MDKVVEIIKYLELCDEAEFYDFLMEKTLVIDNDNKIGSGLIYNNKDKVIMVIPKVVDDITMATALHESGRLYEYYCNGKMTDDLDIALFWEYKYLYYRKAWNLLEHRLSEQIDNPHGEKYRTIKR